MFTRAKTASALFALLMVASTSSCGSQSDSVRDQWNERETFPSCGSVELGQGDKLTASSHSEVSCMSDAIDSGNGAELHVDSPTVEGDTIHDHYRLYPDRHLELYIDSSDDPYSGDDWELIDCIRPVWLPGVTCPDVGPS